MRIDQGYWKGWEVFIQDENGNPLPEYQIVHKPPMGNEPGTVHMFVECEDDQIFSIATRRPHGSQITCRMMPKVDGRALWGRVAKPNDNDVCKESYIYELSNGVMYERPLKFGKLAVVENGPSLSASEKLSLGTIFVSIQSGSATSGGFSMGCITAAGHSVVDEKTKKGMLGSIVSGGQPKPSRGYTTCHFTLSGSAPQYELYISYRTRSTLMAMGIIANPLAVDLAAEDNAGEELKVKKRKRKEKDTSLKRVKKEPGVIDLTHDDYRAPDEPVELENVIDLTEDDSDDDL